MQVFTDSTFGYTNPAVTTIIESSTQNEVAVDGLVVYDKEDLLTSSAFQLYAAPSYKGFISGDIEIHTGSNRPVDDFFVDDATYDGLKKVLGKVSVVDTSINSVSTSNYLRDAKTYSTETGSIQEVFGVRAWLNVNMATNTVNGSGNIAAICR